MDCVKKKLKEIFKSEKLVDVREYIGFVRYREESGHSVEVWTEAFKAAIRNNRALYIPEGKYFIDDSLILPSDRKIVADKKAEICLLKNVKTVLFRNKDVYYGKLCRIGASKPRTKNIFISGGIWSEQSEERKGYGKSGAFDKEDSLHGVSALGLFSGVENLWLKNMRFKNASAFAIQLGRAKNFVIENIRFINCFADGVHVNGEVENGTIKNISGETGDDLVALNPYDWDNSTINNGYLKNVYVKNVYAGKGKGYNAFRIQPGILPEDKGGIDCFIENLYISDVKNASVFKIYLQTPSYKACPDGTEVGHIKNLTLKNISVYQKLPADKMNNYMSGDLITGHFAAFEIGSDINCLTLKNVKVFQDRKSFKKTAHYVTVGPKSCYLKDIGLELFDPYVKCCVEKIEYKNLKLNGKKIKDLNKEIKTIKYDCLNGKPENCGFGIVKEIVRL